MNVIFRPYRSTDYQACIDIFDANCPEFFAPNERQDYKQFLEDMSEEYEVCEANGQVLGAFGLLSDANKEKRLCWIMLEPQSHGTGIGSKIMERIIHLGRASETTIVNIAASQMSAPFFARFGATESVFTRDGWGTGMDRVDMLLRL